MASPQLSPRSAWLEQPERGTVLGIRALAWTARVFGRRAGRLMLRPVALYYAGLGALTGGAAYRGSQAYLRRAVDREDFAAVYRHVLTFAECSFDRIFHAAGRQELFDIERNGHEHFDAIKASGRGALLLGAHVGSFEALRSVGRETAVPINILAHFRNAARITAFLRAVAPDFDGRVIEIDPDAPHFILAARECVEAGELVAVLGDRIGLGERTATASFFGAPAQFPTGPYALAAALRCPVYLTVGLYEPPRRYRLYVEPFAETIELPRGQRSDPAAVAPYVQRYAERLEWYCRQAPYNWFNFYDFWA